MTRISLLLVLAACGSSPHPVHLVETWPETCGGDYKAITESWTRTAVLRGQYQEVLDLYAVFKSPDWRAAHAARDAEHRGLSGDAKAQTCAQAQADMSGPYEVELIVSTLDRRENDLDRGKKSVWRVVLVDESGKEIEPLEIVKDKRPQYTLHAEFPSYGDFAVAYVARFPHDPPLLGPNVHSLRLRLSGERGGVEVAWNASSSP